MRKLLVPLFVFVCALATNHFSPVQSSAPASFPHRQQDADRFQLRRRSLDRQPRRRRRSPPHFRRRHRGPSIFLSRRLHGRLHRRIRRQSRCLRRSRHRRRARAASPIIPRKSTSPVGLPTASKILFNSWGNSFMHFEDQLYTVPVEGGFPTQLPLPIAEDASYSPDGTHLAYVPHPKWQQAWKRYHGGQTTPIWIADLKDSSIDKDSPRQLQRSPPHVGRRHDLFPLRPQRPRQPLRLRHQDQAGFRSSSQRRPRFQDRHRRSRRHRDRAVRRHQALRPQYSSGQERNHPCRRRHRCRASALRQSRAQAHPEFRHLSHRRPRCLRSLGRDFHRSHRQRRHSQHHAQSRRRRSRSFLVARRQVHRILF